MKTQIQPLTIWYAIEDTQILERVQILGTAVFPGWGKYTLYRLIDWPDSSSPHPLCVHEDTFRLLYTPMDEPPCENQPRENFSSKTTSQPRQFFSTALRGLWRWARPRNNNFW